MKSEKRGKCGCCEKEYEPYLILFEDDTLTYIEYMTLKEKYGWLCPECLKEEMNAGAFAITNTGPAR